MIPATNNATATGPLCVSKRGVDPLGTDDRCFCECHAMSPIRSPSAVAQIVDPKTTRPRKRHGNWTYLRSETHCHSGCDQRQHMNVAIAITDRPTALHTKRI